MNIIGFINSTNSLTSQIISIISGCCETSHWCLTTELSWNQIPISAIISIFIFILGWLFTRIFKLIDEFYARKRFKNTVLKWIELVIPTEQYLADSLNNLSHNILESDNMQPEAYQKLNTIPDKIKDMSVEKMIDSFGRGRNEKQKSTNLYNIISMFDYLTKMNDEIKNEYNRYNDQAVLLYKEWNNYIIPFSVKIEQSNNVELQKLLIDWKSELSATPDSLITHKKYLERLTDTALLDMEMRIFVINMNRVLSQIKANNKGYAIIFKKISEAITTSISVLSEAHDFFKNK